MLGDGMRKEQFIEFVENNILSLFTGSEIAGEEPSTPRDSIIAQGLGGSVLIKCKKTDDYRLNIKRIQPFKAFEISLVKNILEELTHIQKFGLHTDYAERFQSYAIEKAICKAIAYNNVQTLYELIHELTIWGDRTYEGKNITFGFIITTKKASKNTNHNLHIKHMLAEDFSALLSNGKDTCLTLSADGYLTDYTPLPQIKDPNLFAPIKYLKIANLCTGNKIGVVLRENGDILLFKNKTLLFARNSGFWSCYSHEEIIDRLGDTRNHEDVDEIRKAIYLTALDTAFERCGGCIVHLNKDESFNVLRHIDAKDILLEPYYNKKVEDMLSQSFFFELTDQAKENYDYKNFLQQEQCIKTAALQSVIKGKKFNELNRKLRQELLSIDGATIINNDGTILAVGAIIKIEAGSSGGGRLAATKTLAKYGVAIKISADGSIQGFKMDRSKLRARPIFAIG